MQILGHGIRKTGMGVLSAHRTGWYVGRLPARTQVFFSSFFFLPIRALQTVCTNSRLFFWESEFVSTNFPRRLCGLRRFSVLFFFFFFTLSLCPRTDHVFVASLWTKCTKTWLVHVFVHQADFLFFFPHFFPLSFFHTRTHMHIYTHINAHTCMHTHIHTDTHTHIRTYIHTRIHTHKCCINSHI